MGELHVRGAWVAEVISTRPERKTADAAAGCATGDIATIDAEGLRPNKPTSTKRR